MASPVEIAVDRYIRAWSERDPAARAALLEQCFAEDGRIVTTRTEIRGRAALDAAIARFHADGKLAGIRVTALEAHATIFRLVGAADFHDGTSAEAFDAGEIDGDGRIALILTFPGRL